MQFAKDVVTIDNEPFLEAKAFLLSFDGIVKTQNTRITNYFNEKIGIYSLRKMPFRIDIGFFKRTKNER